MKKTRTCPNCHGNNGDDDGRCADCGRRLITGNDENRLDTTTREDALVVCPFCGASNRAKAVMCASCGVDLKACPLEIVEDLDYDTEDQDEGNEREQKSIIKKIATGMLSGALIIAIVIALSGQPVLLGISELIPKIFELIPRKIVQINDLENYVNQNERFALPDKIGAKMEYGSNTTVPVRWETNTVDTSSAGIKTIKGTIAGYDRTVLFTLKVLPHQIQTSLSSCTVENSLLELKTNVRDQSQWIWFNVEKDGQIWDEIIAVNHGVINARLYLPYGAGDYRIEIRINSSDRMEGTYYRGKEILVSNNDFRDMSFLLPNGKVQSDAEQIRVLAYRITEKSVTDMEKTEAIHDWVCTNIAYDVAAIVNNTAHEYSALETLTGKKAVCNGYANLTAALNRAVGIRAKVISGTAQNKYFGQNSQSDSHAWNETLIDGKWISQDTTWDAGGIDETTQQFRFRLSHEFFNPAVKIFEQSHTKESER